MHVFKYSLTEIENMIPWELEIYTGLLNEHLEEEKRQHEEEARRNK
jgi:hypothetical protein